MSSHKVHLPPSLSAQSARRPYPALASIGEEESVAIQYLFQIVFSSAVSQADLK